MPEQKRSCNACLSNEVCFLRKKYYRLLGVDTEADSFVNEHAVDVLNVGPGVFADHLAWFCKKYLGTTHSRIV